MKTGKFTLGRLSNLSEVTRALAKIARAMADGTLDGQLGARISNVLGIMRACLETQKLEQLEARIDEVVGRIRDHDRPRGGMIDARPETPVRSVPPSTTAWASDVRASKLGN
jgi:hypothetical protein